MNEFAADKMVHITANIEYLEKAAIYHGQVRAIWSAKEADKVKASLQSILKDLDLLSLGVTKADCERLISEVGTIKVADLQKRGVELRHRLNDELRQKNFFWVSQEELKFYNQSCLFGKTVAEKFPTAEYDIREAGNCYALARHTAAVLHCMRVLEVGLSALATALKVKNDEKSWQHLLNHLQGAWNAIESGARKPSGWTKLRQFYSECFIEFRHFKDAWRNHAMHARSTYDEEKAKLILEHTKSFMKHLATKLKA